MRSKSVAWGNVIPPAALLLLAVIAAGPLWGPGLLNTRGGGDSPFLLLRTHQLAANLRAGVLPARWMPDAAYGLGYPFFSYYAALPYYLAAGLTLVGLDVLSAIKLAQTLFFAAAALAMYGWARRTLHSRAGGWLAAVAYTFAPFHLVNVYVRGDSLSEFAAFAFYPLILLSLDHLAARPSPRRTLPPALAYAGLILTHNISALIFSPFVLLYVAFYVLRFTFHVSRFTPRKTLSYCSLFIAPLFIGLLLTIWFWLPALAETDQIQLTAQTTGYFFYGSHFREGDLVQWRPIFDYTISSGSSSPFAMGLVQAALTLAGILASVVAWIRSQHATRNTQHASRNTQHATRFTLHASRFAHFVTHPQAFILAGFILSTWLITPLSRPLWDRLPLLPMVQFPWRFLSVQALFGALFAGAVIRPLRRRRPAARCTVVVVLGVLVGAAALAGLRPEYLPITAEDVTVERLQLYELFTGNVGSTIRYEYLPRWVKPRPYTGPALFDPGASPRAIPLRGNLPSAERIVRRPTRRLWRVEADANGAEVAFPLYYWPGWRATVDGAPIDVKPDPGSGHLTLSVPAGPHTVEIWLGRTPLRLGAELVSLATALALLMSGIVRRWPGARCKGQEARDRGQNATLFSPPASCFLHLASCILGLFILLTLLVAFSPRVESAERTDLTMDFERMPYLHHNPDGVALDGWRLLGYRYSAEEFAPGETLHVTLDSETGEISRARLRLVSPAAVRHRELTALAEETLDLEPSGTSDSSSAILELSIPQDAAPGLYLLQLTGDPPVYLRPVWVSDGEKAAGEPIRATFADDALRLHAVEAAQPRPDQLNVQLDWSAAEPVAANYGLSLRLVDAAGNEWAREDTQPGYGFLPTSLWPVGRLLYDRHVLSLPEGAPPGDSYALRVVLYRVATWDSVGEYTTRISLNQVTRRSDASVIARLNEELALSQLDVPDRVRQGDVLRATAYWLAMKKPTRDYVAEWRLKANSSFEIRDSRFAPLAPGSSPIDWPVGAWIAGRATLTIPPTAPPGDYTLSLTLRDPTSGAQRGAYVHPQPVRVRGRERTLELPPMEREVGGRFGDVIELAGYDLEQDEGKLRLMLHWRALAVPDRHYMFFVHLADPATGRPMTQVDTMPREFTYPTGMWAPGEVVSDEVALSLEGVPAGRYDLVVGWYDPETEDRLRALDSAGKPWPDDRLILPDTITLP